MAVLLVVDDCPIFRSLIVDYFLSHSNDYQRIYQASSGKEAIEMLNFIPVDVLLLNFCIRNDGVCIISILQMMKEKFPDLLVVTYSGDTYKAFEVKLNKVGSSFHFQKPFLLSELYQKVESLRKDKSSS